MLKKLLTNTAIYGLAPYVPKILGLFTLPIITQDLTSLDYGIAGVVGAYTGAIGVFATLGLRLILVNSYYHYASQYKWMWRQIYGFLSLWAFGFSLIMSALLFFVIPQEARDNRFIIIILNVIPLVLFGPVGMMGSAYYQLEQRPFPIALRTIVFGLLTIVLNVYFISWLKMGYIGWFLAECIVSVLQNASYWLVVNLRLRLRPIFNFKWRLIRKVMKISLPTIPHYYSSYLLNSSDRMIMDWLKVPTASIGRYNIAGNFGNYFNSFSMAAGTAIAPMLNKLYKERNEVMARNLIWLLQTIFLLCTFSFALWAKEIFAFLIRNESLRDTYPLAVIIVMAYNYRPMYFGSNNLLFFKEKTNVLWRITFVAGLINVGLNVILIPYFGIEVAAWTTFIAYMYMGYSGFVFKEYRSLATVNLHPLVWLSITIGLTVVAYLMKDAPSVVKVLISGACMLILIWVYRKYRNLLNDYK